MTRSQFAFQLMLSALLGFLVAVVMVVTPKPAAAPPPPPIPLHVYFGPVTR